MTVTTQADCPWTATHGTGTWATLAGASSGTGSGAVAYAVRSHDTLASRTETVTVGGQAIALTQDGLDEEPGLPKKVRWGISLANDLSCEAPQRLGPGQDQQVSRAAVHCKAKGYHAFSPPGPFGPPIQWDLTFRFTFGHNRVEYAVDGCKTAFPAFEIYGNQKAILEMPDSGNVRDLQHGCDQSVHLNGVIQ